MVCIIYKIRYLVTDSKRLENKITDIGVIFVNLDFANKINTIAIFHIGNFDLPKSYGVY
jgi:hypothetical protein